MKLKTTKHYYSHLTGKKQINKVIDENEKCVFYFTEKSKMTFWPTQYFVSATPEN